MARLTLFFFLLGLLQVVANDSYSQSTRISISVNDEKLEDVINLIEDQSEFFFLYNKDLIDVDQNVSIDVKDKTVNAILDQVLKGKDISYAIYDRQIVLTNLGNTGTSQQQQKNNVAGKVTDEGGEPLPGVTVIIKGTTHGTVTDIDGKYVLTNIPDNAVLQFSFVGMKTQEVVIDEKTEINMVMLADAIGLEEVVAIGYGIIKKSDLTGSVGSVTSENIASKGSTSVMESIQGQVAGVNIQQSSSRAGDGFSIQIRGKSSLQGGDPLYVIDGIVCDNMDFLNPMDIEKIDVLKDASSTAIYGSRATNGVLMITTKQGADVNKTTISYDGYYGISTDANMPEFMDGDEFMSYRFSRYLSSSMDESTGSTTWAMTDANFANVWGAGSDITKQFYLDKQYTYWPDLILRTGQQQNHFINISGKGNKTSYCVGLGYQDEDGIYYDSYTRWNIKASINSKINEKVSIGFNTNLATSIQKRGSENSISTGFAMNPLMPCYYWEGENEGELIYQPGKDEAVYPDGGGPTSTINPIVDRQNSSDDVRSYYVMANAFLQYSPIKDVVLKTTFSPMYKKEHNGVFYGEKTQKRKGQTNYAENNNDEVFSYTWDTQVNYKKRIGDHNFGFLGLVSVYSETSEGDNITVVDMPFDVDWYNLSSGTVQTQGSYYEKITMLSYVARLNYDYKGKYLLTVSSRWDGSSKFEKDNRWGMFPSAAVAWRMTEEDFMSDINWLSNLKLRLSYGVTGNNSLVGAYDTQALADTKYYYNYGSTVANGYGYSLTNSNLTWEKTNEIDAGIDFGLLNNRITGAVDYYNKVSRDLLMEMETPLELGSSTGSIWSNVGKVRNKGIEFQLSTVNVKRKDLKWTTSFTIAHNKNEILELNGEKEDLVGNRWFIGQPIDVVFGYVMDGICTADEATSIAADNTQKTKYYEGEMKFKDIDNSGSIDEDDRVIQGHAEPNWTGSIFSNLIYKNFDFSFSIYTSQGGTVYSPFMDSYTGYSSRGTQHLKIDYYIPDGAPILGEDAEIDYQDGTHYGKYPFPTNGSDNKGGGTYYLDDEDGSQNFVDNSYVKVKNITVGYTLPTSLISKAHISKLRVYFNVLNPFTFTDYKGFDPEWADAELEDDTDGIGGVSTRTYQIGVNLSF